MAVFPTIPDAIATAIVQVSRTTGCPASWLAAVASRTNFDTTYSRLNVQGSYSTCTPAFDQYRQWGIAGAWGYIPELVFPTTAPMTGYTFGPYACGCGAQSAGGWLAGSYGCFFNCYECACSTSLVPFASTDVNGQLTDAAHRLLDCQTSLLSIFGGLNPLLFYRYAIGCNYVPQKDPVSGLGLVPLVPSDVTDAVWYYLQAQAFYAVSFGETPVTPNPPSAPQCPTGYSWSNLLGKCCNQAGQCIIPEVCPQCTLYDANTNACVPQGCPTCPCPQGQTCINGACLLPCTVDSDCPAGYICVNGFCVRSCTADSDCAAPATCGCTSPSGSKYCCTSGGGGFPWWAVLAGVGLAALAFAALYKQPCGGPQDEPCPQGSTCINGYCEPYTTTYQPNYTLVR